ncbi:MAG: hypothetical protein H6719_11085 [Sandaracinaceae bacterium]|nr:hypothetical protein [Sandaracinaceae bacterium]
MHRGRGTAAKVQWIDEAARAAGVRPGQTLAAARARCASLESALVDATLLAEAHRLVTGALLRWTPRVSADGVGRFWCEPVGARWIDGVRAALSHAGPVHVGVGAWAAVAYAAARTDAGAVDDAHLDAAPLAALELPPRAIEGLASLGVRSVRALRALDPVDVGVRFGPEVAAAWRRAGGDDPRGPRVPPVDEPPSVSIDLDDVELDRLEPLLFVLRPALERLLHEPRGRGLGVTALELELRGRRGVDPVLVTIRGGGPIADPRLLLELAHAHLERLEPTGPVTGLALVARELAPLTDRNVPLFAEPRRDPAAREVALARLSSRFGAHAIRRASRVELASALSRAAWTGDAPVAGPALPWREQVPPVLLHGEWIELAGRRRRLVRLGRVERALAPFWLTGALRVERLAWAEVDGPLLVMLRARRPAAWEAVAFVD